MSDVPQGPGWWQASDDKWYPPPRPAMPSDAQAAPSVTGAPASSSPVHGSPVHGSPVHGSHVPGAATQAHDRGVSRQAGPAPGASVPTHAQAMPPAGHTPPPSPAVAPTSPSPGGVPVVGPPSPYDLPPVGRPPGAGADRPMGLYAVLGVLVLALLVSVVMLVSDDGDEGATDDTTTTTAGTGDSTSTSGSDTTATTTGDTTNSSAATGEGEVVAVEQGVTSFEDPLLEAETYSWGVVVENRSEQVAYGTTVVVGILNEQDQVVDNTEVVIQVLLPGQRFGFGEAPYEEVAGVASLDIRVEPPTEWRDPEGYAEITTGDIDISYDSYEQPRVSFEAENPYDQRIDNSMAYAIFRNEAGDIVGGARTSDIPYMPPGGSISGSIEVFSAIPDIDQGKTEVHIDPMGLS